MATVTNQLMSLLEHNGGVLRFSDARALGVSAPSITKFARKEGLERVGKGFYIDPNAWIDEMHVLSLRIGKAVFSHESALLLHGLAEREPEQMTVTVPSGYNATGLRRDGVCVHYVRPELHSMGRVEMPTFDGNLVATYDLERTICDLIRNRSRIEKQVFISALQSYARSPQKRLDFMSEYAARLGIERVVRNYLEVLL
ncbi:MAG: type IV toxin-antitoxin system AbiEi family antitoxin domain-containing protein [Ancrocorticia sp.]